MAMLSQLRGASANYPCPMCGTPVSSSAVYCPTCSTDLTRAGAVFTSSGTPVLPKRGRGRAGLWFVLAGAIALGVTAGTVGWPGLTQYTEPGLAVLKGMAKSARGALDQKTIPPADQVKVEKKAPAPAVTPPVTPPKTAVPVTNSTAAPAPRPATAILTISSTPRGARVRVDGVPKGVTPVTIKELHAGTHTIRISHPGYRSVTRTVALGAGRVLTVGVSLPAEAPAKVANLAAKPAPVRPPEGTLLEVGRPAPPFVAKDRIGLLYRLTDFKGRKLLMVFVQNLDGEAQRIIREINAVHAGGTRGAAVVVVMRPNRTAIRQFTQTDQIRIPLLFGTQPLARAYGVTSQPAVLYLVSEEGRVVLRQVGRVNPRAGLN